MNMQLNKANLLKCGAEDDMIKYVELVEESQKVEEDM
jgi:hypothetical protein